MHITPVSACGDSLLSSGLFMSKGTLFGSNTTRPLLQGATEQRNANYAAVVRHLRFSRKAWSAEEGGAPPQSRDADRSVSRKKAGAGEGLVEAEGGPMHRDRLV